MPQIQLWYTIVKCMPIMCACKLLSMISLQFFLWARLAYVLASWAPTFNTSGSFVNPHIIQSMFGNGFLWKSAKSAYFRAWKSHPKSKIQDDIHSLLILNATFGGLILFLNDHHQHRHLNYDHIMLYIQEVLAHAHCISWMLNPAFFLLPHMS